MDDSASISPNRWQPTARPSTGERPRRGVHATRRRSIRRRSRSRAAWASTALLRGQEPRLLDPPVGRLGGYFFLRTLSGIANDGLDAPRPHAAADRDRLFDHPADGVAVPPADPDAAALDLVLSLVAVILAAGGLLGDRDVERRDLRQSAVQPGGRRLFRRDPAQFLAARRLVGALLQHQFFHPAGGGDPASASGSKARPRPRSSRCCATSSTRISCSTR